MLQDCKYRLPCNWCDKYDRMCEAVLFEINNVGCQAQAEHDCNWIVARAEAVTKEEAGCATYYTQRCSVCGKERIKKVEFDGNHKSSVTIWELKT